MAEMTRDEAVALLLPELSAQQPIRTPSLRAAANADHFVEIDKMVSLVQPATSARFSCLFNDSLEIPPHAVSQDCLQLSRCPHLRAVVPTGTGGEKRRPGPRLLRRLPGPGRGGFHPGRVQPVGPGRRLINDQGCCSSPEFDSPILRSI